MQYYTLSPEVAGGIGPNTVMSREQHPPVVLHLHYEFDVWLGDDLLEGFPCFIVTQRLADELLRRPLSGYKLNMAEISMSDQFHELYPDRALPHFLWLAITGKAALDDFGVDADGRLVVSETALDALNSTQLDNCEVSALS